MKFLKCTFTPLKIGSQDYRRAFIKTLFKQFILFLFGLMSLQAFAKEMNLVIDIKGVILTKVPHTMAESYGGKVIKFGQSRIQKNKNTYVLTPQIAEFFQVITKNKNVKIHYLNNLPVGDPSSVLAQTTIKGSNKTLASLGKIVSTKKSLETFQSLDQSLDTVFYLSGEKEIVKGMQTRTLVVDNEKILLFNFNEIQGINKELKDFPRLAKKLKNRFPGDLQSWEESQYRLAAPALILTQLLNSSGKGFDLSKRNIADQDSAHQTGRLLLSGDFIATGPKWIVSGNGELEKIGCSQYDFLENKELATLDVSACKNVYRNWGYFYSNNRDKHCHLFVQINKSVYKNSIGVDASYCKQNRILVRSEDHSKFGILYLNQEVSQLNEADLLKRALKSGLSFIPSNKETFGKILTQKSDGRLVHSLGGAGSPCVEALRHFYKNGGLLEMDSIKSKLIPLRDYKIKTGIDSSFYHYTSAINLYNLLQPSETDRKSVHDSLYSKGEEGYGNIFYYLKNLGNPTYDAFYMAEDPESSRNYGHIQLKFYLSDDAMVFDDQGNYQSTNSFEALTEIAATYPEIYNACSNHSLQLYYFALDDSGADILDYYNYNQWFKITNSSIITGCEVGYK